MTPAPGDVHGAGDRDGRLLLAAVRLVERAVAASRHHGPGSDDPTPGATLLADKVCCEAAMLLRAAAPLADRVPGLASALDGLAAALEPPDADELAVRLCLHPGIALDLALVPLHLRSLGLGDARLDPLLDDLLGADRLRGPERPANRELEQVWLHQLWSGDAQPAALARVLPASSLAWEFDHLAGTTDDAYAFTHAILYATDNGRRSVRLPRDVLQVVADAEGILAVALDAGNHDVAAEVLWTWPMLDQPWTPLAAHARSFLAHVASSRGFLPGPGFDALAHARLAPPRQDSYVLRTSYHTTLVHGILLAAELLRRDRSAGAAPERLRPKALRPSGLVVELRGVLPPRGPGAQWWAWFADLPEPATVSLAPALATMALRRAVSAADLPLAHRVLQQAEHNGVPDAPAIRQAHVLLRRAVVAASSRPAQIAAGRVGGAFSRP